MSDNLVLQIKDALQKAGITLHIWSPEQANRAVELYSIDEQVRLEARLRQQLGLQTKGRLPKGHVYNLGSPDRSWLTAGISNVPIRLKAETVEELLQRHDNRRVTDCLNGLIEAMRNPAAIFRLEEQQGQHSVLVCLDRPENPLMLKVDYIPITDRKEADVVIDRIYPIREGDEKYWMTLLQIPGKALYIDKRQILDLLEQYREQAGTEKTLDWKRMAETVERFQNPRFEKQVSLGLTSFYSNARYALENIRQEKATPVQWLAMLQKAGGIKAGEDRWTGLSEWLKGSKEKTLTRNELIQYIDNHRIRIGEVEYHVPEKTPRFAELQQEFQKILDEMLSDSEKNDPEVLAERAFQEMVERYGDDFNTGFSHWDGKLRVDNDDVAAFYTGVNAIQSTRLSNVTEGLDNYHELAFYVDGITSWQDDDAIHFGEVGMLQGGQCIAWVRFGEKTIGRKPTMQEKWELARTWPGPEAWECRKNAGTDRHIYTTGQWDFTHEKAMITETGRGFSLYNMMTGRSSMHDSLDEAADEYMDSQISRRIPQKILFIDEIQSNRHQEGREHGYRDENVHEKAMLDYYLQSKMLNSFQEDMARKYGKKFGFELKSNELTDEERQQHELLKENFNRAYSLYQKQQEIPPPAPFEKNWHELCMKRMLIYAAENGFDNIAWTTGEQQGDRYRLGTSLNGLKAMPYRGGTAYESLARDRIEGYEVRLSTSSGDIKLKVTADGTIMDTDNADYKKARLSDVIGKRLAGRILSSDRTVTLSPSETGYVMNIEGMRAFYDEILPAFMNKYGKKWGMQVEETNIPQLGRWHMVTVTPLMKEAVRKGQPLFMFDPNGKVLGLALDDHIYLTPEGLKPETLLHEYTHVWALAMKNGNREGWESVKNLLRDSPVWGEIIHSPVYSDIRENEDAVASEVLAHISGKANAQKLVELEKVNPVDVMSSIRQSLEKFWSWVGKHLFDLKQFTSIDDITDRILYDLAVSTPLEVGPPIAHTADHERLSEITVYRGKGDIPHIRCKIDGIQQLGKPLKGMDKMMIGHNEYLKSLAERYFHKELKHKELRKPAVHR